MNSSSNTALKAALALSALALISSLYAASRASGYRASMEASAAAAAAEAIKARRLADDARARLGHGSSDAEPLGTALARLAEKIRSARAANGVAVSEIVLENASTFGEASDLSSVAKPVAIAPGLHRASITIKGAYARLDGLKAYLSTLSSPPAALAALRLDEYRFEAKFNVFGR